MPISSSRRLGTSLKEQGFRFYKYCSLNKFLKIRFIKKLGLSSGLLKKMKIVRDGEYEVSAYMWLINIGFVALAFTLKLFRLLLLKSHFLFRMS